VSAGVCYSEGRCTSIWPTSPQSSGLQEGKQESELQKKIQRERVILKERDKERERD
jgi:hypothetical protein